MRRNMFERVERALEIILLLDLLKCCTVIELGIGTWKLLIMLEILKLLY
jgi:hypothetical protein